MISYKQHIENTQNAVRANVILFNCPSLRHFLWTVQLLLVIWAPPTDEVIYIHRMDSRSFKVIWGQHGIKKLEYNAHKDRVYICQSTIEEEEDLFAKLIRYQTEPNKC